jgi:hypothetical protein
LLALLDLRTAIRGMSVPMEPKAYIASSAVMLSAGSVRMMVPPSVRLSLDAPAESET